jgi:hypothetical protein
MDRSKEDRIMDDDIQKEIEANQARARDKRDVGLDENYIQDREQGDNFVTDAADAIFNPDDEKPDEREHEFDDNTKST